jgi:hypothetical protein
VHWLGMVYDGYSQIFSGNILQGFKTLGQSLLEFVLIPLRMILRGAIKVADAVGVDIPDAVREFSEEGIADILPDLPETAADAAAQAAKNKQDAAETPKQVVEVLMEDKRTVEVNATLNLDNKQVAGAVQKHKQEVQDRSGFKANPWQRRMAAEHAAVPMPKGG